VLSRDLPERDAFENVAYFASLRGAEGSEIAATVLGLPPAL
jgi:hypothetical protein